ncbi:glycosyltransferase family 2 protein [Butyrivibrio sp. AE2015]|uniref:glycosyltransferase family 2 protein n=1 Tax=Butyrivibrio sp. AE2015 TaxID=1280663 RepID=UPI0003B30288|nr:glycosyltransferase family 2 protein [Butyrivibrio sp. AE2015]
MNDIKVSIVVAIYKSEPFLRKLLESIVIQTYKNIEVILVDDGSPDGSGRICDEYKEKDNRFFVIHKENGGACEARNIGMQASSGEYITIIDGDDWLEPDYIEYLLYLVEETHSDMAMTDRIFTTRDRKQTQKDSIEVWTSEKAAGSIIYPFIPIGPWNKLYRLKVLRDNNISFSVPWSGEGLYFSFMAAQYSNQVAVGHKKIYNYRMNNIGSGLTNYNVQMGINALWNIKNIGNNIRGESRYISNAVQWHIWKNYNFLLFLIIATNTQSTQYITEYMDCLREIRKRLFGVLLKSDMGPRTKLKLLFQGLFPVAYAKHKLKVDIKALQKDDME